MASDFAGNDINLTLDFKERRVSVTQFSINGRSGKTFHAFNRRAWGDGLVDGDKDHLLSLRFADIIDALNERALSLGSIDAAMLEARFLLLRAEAEHRLFAYQRGLHRLHSN